MFTPPSQLGTVMSTASISADSTSAGVSNSHSALTFQTLQTGTLVGPVYLQGSNDGVTFVTLTDSAGDPIVVATLAGAPATFVQPVDGVYVPYFCLFFDRTSGTGTIAVTAVGM